MTILRYLRQKGARPAGLLLAAATALPLLSACSTVPATGERKISLVSQEEEKKLGAEQHPKILAEFGGEYQDKATQDYVRSIGELLARSSELPGLDWHFTVIDSDIINAFALPGGYIYITRGLMALADDEAQLASVIGHEIGHVTGRHYASRHGQAVGAQLGVGILSILAGIAGGGQAAQTVGQIGGVAAQGYLASYGREQELESDSLGIRYMSRTGYDTAASAEFLGKLDSSKTLLARLRDETPPGASYLDTHPPSAERVREAQSQIVRPPAAGAGRARGLFLEKLNGMIYGDSPEQGFRNGRQFQHPGLRLEFVVPPDFYLQNFPDKVVASGPEGTLIIFNNDPRSWSGNIRNYLVQQWAPKTQVYDLEAITINGLPAATGWVRGRTNSGQVDVRLVAVRWPNGRIYRFQFIAPSNRSSHYSEDFQRTTYSFRQISEREASALKPNRIRIHTVRGGETFEDLARLTPFEKLAADHLRVLNGYSAGQQPRAGDVIKLVINEGRPTS